MFYVQVSNLIKRFTDPVITRFHHTSVWNLLMMSGFFGLLGNLLYLFLFIKIGFLPLIISTITGSLFYFGLLITKSKPNNTAFWIYTIASALTIQQVISAWYIGPDGKFQVLILIVPLILIIGLKSKPKTKAIFAIVPIAIFLLIENEIVPGFEPKFEIKTSTISHMDTLNTSIVVAAFFTVFFLYYYRLDKTNLLLNLKYEEALKLSEAKSKLISNISHEMKTPLNAILGLTQLLEMKKQDDESKMYSTDIKINAEKLILKIQQVLDYTAFTYNEIVPKMTEITGVEFKKQWEQLFKYYSIQSSVKYEIVSQIPDNVCLQLDHHLLVKAVKNLIENAIKYTERGSIKIIIKINELEINKLQIQISDTGIGIKPEILETIYEPFESDENNTTKLSGLGLGLAISKKIIDALHGTMVIESTPQLGTTVNLCTPISILDKAVESIKALKPRHILIVDDNKINALVASKFIEKMGFDFVVCDNAKSAYIEVEKHSYDLILMDHMMPEIDGSTATKYIKNNVPGYQKVPIVAYTANLQMDNYLSLGFDDILMKPIRYSDIEKLINKHLG